MQNTQMQDEDIASAEYTTTRKDTSIGEYITARTPLKNTQAQESICQCRRTLHCKKCTTVDTTVGRVSLGEGGFGS